MNIQTIRMLVLGSALLAGTSTSALADGMAYGRSQAPAPLEGTWNVVITPYICATGTSIPEAAFRSRLMFHAGGTLTETTFNALFQPGQRSIGMGHWERTGQGTYDAVFENFILFTSVVTPPATPFYRRGFQRVEQGIEMIDNDHWKSSASVVFRDEALNVVPPSGCMTARGERQQ